MYKSLNVDEAQNRETFFKHIAKMMGRSTTHQSLMARPGDIQTKHIEKFYNAEKTPKQCFDTMPVVKEGKVSDLKDDKLKKLYSQMKDEQLSGSAAAQFKDIVREMKKRKMSLNEVTTFAELFNSLSEGSTEDAAKSLTAILGMFKDKHDNDIYKMGKGIQDYYKKEGSFSPDLAKWIWKTSVALFK